MALFQAHRRARMGGRDPHEAHRAATPLELFFDLVFVVAFGTAANELAHYLAEGHIASGLLGFAFATFAVAWAWINFTWFASAFDTDDWIFRLTTMVQMLGVLILALGLPPMFASIDEGEFVDNGVMVAGYVVMRGAMVFQWLRAARQDPVRRRACLTYATAISIAQVGWIALLIARTSILVTFLWAAALVLAELAGPVLAETRKGGTPWHAHHIAERHGLLVIVTLGEGLLGTTIALSAIVGPEGPGWSADVVVLGLAGTALAFGMWWIYFILPCGELLHRFRSRSFGWGYGHIVVFGAAVAVGAGMHAAAYHLEHHSVLDVAGTVLTVALPVAVYVLSIYVLFTQLTRVFDPFHLLLLAGSAVLVVASVVLAVAGAPMVWCLAVLALTPWVTVVGYETVGHRHGDRLLLGDGRTSTG
ncbi:low temperature requirement protein A [Geodermatophilus sp. YIM 151500]|uniref:low temperature requirement protein A n=1 Tax=Geodermatophilus sp. YIM 151500 TaxID=2984531 RepID=UPI0021E43C01|nr:low temperature requirement protein A [Geodermatophilus sp. YIM 151500]MCV2489156.1 low temperature requirement protein A [Geodermatophilus sp. YIM 151500]